MTAPPARAVPAHHRALRRHRDDPVDARARSASARSSSGRSPLTRANPTVSDGVGPAPDRHRRRRLDRSAPPPAPPPAAPPVGDSDHRRPVAQAQRRVRGGGGPRRRATGRSRSSTKTWAADSAAGPERPAGSPRPLLRKAERILDSRPASTAGDLLAPRRRRTRAAAPPAPRSARSACPPRPGRADRPGPGLDVGHAPAAQPEDRPVWVPAGMTRSSVPSRVSKSKVGAERGLGHGQVQLVDQVVAVAHETGRGAGPGRGRTGRRAARRGARRAPRPVRRSVEPSSTPAGTSTV